MSELTSEACVLHMGIFIALDREIAKGTPEYSRFELLAGSYLGEGDAAKCSSMIDLLKKMQTLGLLKVGDYKKLKDMLSEAGLVALCKMVEKREVEIVKILGKCGDETGAPSPADCRSSPHDTNTGPANSASPTMEVRSQPHGNMNIGTINASDQSIGVNQGVVNFNDCTKKLNIEQVKAMSHMFREHYKKNTRTFVETSLYQETKRMIEDNNSLLVLGGMGDGKSSIVKYIAAHHMNEYLLIDCTSADDVKEYATQVQGTNIKLIFVCDNSFGDSYKIQESVDKWVKLSNHLSMYLITHKLIMVSRTTIWKDCETALKKFQIFNNIVNITSAKLTRDDTNKLLEKYLVDKDVDVDVEQILFEVEQPIAFALCCTFMHSFISGAEQQHQRSVTEQVIKMFERPFKFLQNELQAMADNSLVKYYILSLIMLCGDEIECEQLSNVTDDEVQQRMDAVAEVYGKQLNLQENARRLCDTYLVKTQKTGNNSDSCDIYKFSHTSIAEAVSMKFGQDNFQLCLKYLKQDVVVNIVRPKNYEKKEEEFAINVPDPKKYYGKIAELFTQKVIDANGSRDKERVCENPCVSDELFLSMWIDYLTKTSPEKLVPFCQSKDDDDRCVLYHLAESGVDKLVRYLCEHPARQTLTLTCNCRREDRLPCPIEGAVHGDQAETFTYLLTVYTLNQRQVTKAVYEACVYDMKNWVLERLLSSYTLNQKDFSMAVIGACRSDSVCVLKVLLPQLHEDREQTIKTGLWWACSWGQVSTVRYLLSEVCTPCEGDQCGCVKGLLVASRRGRTDTVRLILSSGHKAGINTQNVHGVSVLHLSAYNLHNVIIRELVDNGADVNIADRWGLTPLHAAIMRTYTIYLRNKLQWETDEEMRDRRRDVVQTLCHQSCVIMATDQRGRTALDVAVRRGYTDIVKLFGSHGYESRNVDRLWLEPNWVSERDMWKTGYR